MTEFRISGPARRILVYGVGQLAELAYYYFSIDSPHEVCGFVVDPEFSRASEFCGLPVIAPDLVIRNHSPRDVAMFVAISYTSMNHERRVKCDWARDNGYELISYVSTRATTFENLRIGDNCFILEDNTIQPFVTVGNNVIMWSGNHIGHHSVIEDDVFITSHCVVSGNCTVGRGSFLGVNCTIQNGIRVSEKSFVGPRTLVRTDTNAETVLVEEATKPLKTSSRALNL
jgi:sugar O-acyltransferase (sialic acid O-acetyltransferase NeuD family)